MGRDGEGVRMCLVRVYCASGEGWAVWKERVGTEYTNDSTYTNIYAQSLFIQ